MSSAPGVPSPARAVARSGGFSLLGSVTSAVMGLLLTVVIGRALGASGAGVLLQAIAAFTIALSIGKAGLDTTAVWLLPRVAVEDTRQLRPALVGLVTPALGLGVLVGIALYLSAPFIDAQNGDLAESLQVMAWFLPFGTAMIVALSATRGLGGVRPFVLVNSIGVPTLRPLLVLIATWAGAGTLGATLAWVAPLPVAVAVATIVLLRNLSRHEAEGGTRGGYRPERQLQRRIWGYAAPRSISGVLEQAMMWIGVLLVGLLATPAAAGIFGVATRFVGAGLILSTAMRIVVAPLYSRALGLGHLEEAQSLYTTTTKWIVVISTPIYLLLAAFGGTVLGSLGREFASGATTLLILSTGLVVVLLGGNIHSMLLMSGHSGLAAINKLLALITNVAGVFVLVPPLGIEGAALAWSASMVLDAGLAAYQVHRLVGVRVVGSGVMLAAAIPMVTFGSTAVATRLLAGDTLPALVISACSGLILWVALCFVFRRQLELQELTSLLRRR